MLNKLLNQENQPQIKIELKPNVAQFQPQYFRESQTCSWDEKLLKSILGRPVIKSIYDREGDLILDIGDLITYRALERARQANVLELLLRSVYYK